VILFVQGTIPRATSVWDFAGAIIASFGGACVILLALSSWLGKVWASRILEGDRARYAEELENLRQQGSEKLAGLTAELDKFKQTELRIHSDKLIIYRVAIDIVVNIILALAKHESGRLTKEEGSAALEQSSEDDFSCTGISVCSRRNRSWTRKTL